MTEHQMNNGTETDHALSQDNGHEAHEELVAAIASNLRNIAGEIECALTIEKQNDPSRQESEYLVEYLTSRFLGIQCWFAKSEGDRTRTGLRQLANQLGGMMRRFRGSEIEDTRIQGKTDQINGREHQLDILTAYAEAAGMVYEEMTGMNYGPVNAAGVPAATAAAAEANAMVLKYGDKPKPDEGKARDDQPRQYEDENGDGYVLGHDGRYHKLA